MPGLLRGMARVAAVSGTATAVSNRVSRRQGQKWAAQEEQQYAPPPPQQAPTPPTPDPIAQLRQLGELRQQGILTEDEFAQQKARILNR